MVKRMTVMLVCVAVVFGGIFGWKAHVARRAQQAQGQPPPVTVSAMTVARQTWRPVLTADGSLRAVRAVDVTTEVAGLVAAIEFESGQSVAAGDLILRLEDSRDRANLRELQAAQALADIQRRRLRRLVKTDSASVSQLDEAESRYDQAVARVASQQAHIDKKAIRAPFRGRLGIREVDLGQYLSPGTAIVNLQSLAPIHADFMLPEHRLPQIETGQAVRIEVAAYPETVFEGRITAITPAVDEATRNFAVQATLSNEDRRLRPGMFAEVEVILPDRPELLTLPQTAVSYNPYGESVYVIHEREPGSGGEPQLEVERVFVTTGATRGDQVAIVEGLAAGQRVVTSGQHKLRHGDRVRIDNSLPPANEPSPEPPDG